MVRMISLCVVLTAAPAVWAAPIFPTILDHDFGFLASGTYSTNGAAPDTLIIPLNNPQVPPNEVFTYTSPVVPKGPTVPVWDLTGLNFGGDLYLNLVFDGADGPFVDPITNKKIDVSLTGRGNNAQGADLEIWGTINTGTWSVSGLLLAMEIESASLYGYAYQRGYIVEAVGMIVSSVIPALADLQGTVGAVTGSIFYPVFPSQYHPSEPWQMVSQLTYSGEAGAAVPEPATCLVVFLGGLLFSARRKSR